METSVKEFVFLWNVASIRFDHFCDLIETFYRDPEGSGKYHLLSYGVIFQIRDLENSTLLLGPNESREIPIDPPLYLGDSASSGLETYGPFKYLIPCDIFKNEGFHCDPISIKDIMAETHSKLDEYDKQNALRYSRDIRNRLD